MRFSIFRWTRMGQPPPPEALEALIQFRPTTQPYLRYSSGPAGVRVYVPDHLRLDDPTLQHTIMMTIIKAAGQAEPDPDPPNPLTRAEFDAEVAEWAQRLDVKPKQVQLRHTTQIWGSCSGTGRITFSRVVLELPRSLRDYLICHELAHLRELNHKAGFRALIGRHIPDWQERKKALRAWAIRRTLARVYPPRTHTAT